MSGHNQIVSVTFDTRDIQRWALIDLPEAVQRRVVTRALERVAAQTTRNIAEAAPVDTGRLRRSFRYRLDAQDTVALLYVLEDASYWRYLEYGTVYIPAGPFIAPQLLLVENLLREAVRDFFMYTGEKIVAWSVGIALVAAVYAVWWYWFSPTIARLHCKDGSNDCRANVYADIRPGSKQFLEVLDWPYVARTRFEVIRCYDDWALVTYEKPAKDWASNERIWGWMSWSGVEITCKRLYRKQTHLKYASLPLG